ncbi:MAG: LacI family transcriptional regulator [Oscillospiraceae bacterium]|jgi:DNA-binding LacI/PurR family transcriptional regulator|nr:LacI family transcriptional regulator [Oscillospiraceae bacterium]
MNNITIKDIADAAGVSPATVSRAMKNGKNVSAAASRSVREAAEKLGYTGNARTEYIKSGRVLITTPDLSPERLNIINGSKKALQQSEKEMLIFVTDGTTARENIAAQICAEHIADGVLAIDPVNAESFLEKLPIGYPAAFCGCDCESELCAAKSDYAKMGRDVGNYLASRGKEHIVLIAEFEPKDNLRAFEAAFADTFDERTANVRIYRCDLTAEGGAETAARVFSDSPPDAVTCVSDVCLLGVMRGAKRLVCEAASNCLWVGIGNTPYSKLGTAPFSTIDLSYATIGKSTAERLIERINIIAPPERACEIVPHMLIIRE